jgi:hypothetical protein
MIYKDWKRKDKTHCQKYGEWTKGLDVCGECGDKQMMLTIG